jgi:hemoglobin
MQIKSDIETRQDIDKLVSLFYDRLLSDNELKYIFQQTVVPHLAAHLTLIADFWDGILLDANIYRGNVPEKHIALDKKFPLRKEAFNSWLRLWKESIDELFEGEKADLAKTRAQSIADIMEYKLEYLHKHQ